MLKILAKFVSVSGGSMEEQFEISKKYADEQTPVIMFIKKNLLIEVHDENPMVNKRSVVYRAQYVDAEKGSFEKYFLVLNGFSIFGFVNWNYNLIIRMIQFYSKHMLQIYAGNIASENQMASFYYDSNSWEEKALADDIIDPAQLSVF
jgi:hypothetical protein